MPILQMAKGFKECNLVRAQNLDLEKRNKELAEQNETLKKALETTKDEFSQKIGEREKNFKEQFAKVVAVIKVEIEKFKLYAEQKKAEILRKNMEIVELKNTLKAKTRTAESDQSKLLILESKLVEESGRAETAAAESANLRSTVDRWEKEYNKLAADFDKNLESSNEIKLAVKNLRKLASRPSRTRRIDTSRCPDKEISTSFGSHQHSSTSIEGKAAE